MVRIPDRLWTRSAPALIERRLAVLRRVVLCLAVGVPLIGLLPELIYITPEVNDRAFHLGVARNTVAAIREGANPLDFWVPSWLAGYPLFHYYQPGPYLLVALVYELFGRVVPLLVLIRAVMVLALVLFPLANYRALRWLGFGPEVASWGAFLSSLVSGAGTYGIEMESFVYCGWGLFAQAVALPFLPLALAGGWRALRENRSTLGYAALSAAALLNHVLYGYIAGVSFGLIPLMQGSVSTAARTLLRLARFYVQIFALVAFFIVPLALNVAYHGKSLYDEAAKFDSYGAVVILTRLLSGALFDHGRVPAMTILALAGLYLCVWKWLEDEEAVHGWIACGFILWTLLYFGRATWGSLVNLLPLSGGLHFERLSSGMQVFGIWLAAISMAALSRWCLAFEAPRTCVACGCIIAVLVFPMLGERAVYFARNYHLIKATKSAYEHDIKALTPVLRRLRREPLGRVYAGHSGNWGRTYKIGDAAVYMLLEGEAIEDLGNAPFSWPLDSDFQYMFDPRDQSSYDLWNVRYLLTNQSDLVPPHGELLVRSGPHGLYRAESEGPFGIVSVPLAVRGTQENTWYLTMAWTQSAWARRRAHVQLLFDRGDAGDLPLLRMKDAFWYTDGGVSRNIFDATGPFASDPQPPAPGTVRTASTSRQMAEADVELRSPGVILFKVTYHPAWRAFVDGIPAPTMLLTPGFVGVRVSAGSHRIRMVYDPGATKVVLLSVGLLVGVLMDFVPRRASGRPGRSVEFLGASHGG